MIGELLIVASLLVFGGPEQQLPGSLAPRPILAPAISCTPHSPGVRDILGRFVQGESGPGGLFEGADAAALAVVTNGGVCSKLRKEFQDIYDVQGGNSPYIAHYYEVQNKFLVHIVLRAVEEPDAAPPGMVTILNEPSKVFVYDASFNEIGSFLIGV